MRRLAVAEAAASVSQSFAQLSVFIQPALLLVLIWVVAFTTHRAKIQNNAIFQLIRASNKLFTPTDRAINEINSLQDAVAVSLDTIERKITKICDAFAARRYPVPAGDSESTRRVRSVVTADSTGSAYRSPIISADREHIAEFVGSRTATPS